MSITLSSLDLHYIAKELQSFKGSLIDKIFMIENDVFIRVYIQGAGKKVLNITPRFIFVSPKKPAETRAHGFCEFLRKYIERARMSTITQVPGQRILDIELQKEWQYHLYLEFFGMGNIILADEQKTVLGCLHKQEIAARTIKPGEVYTVEERADLFTTASNELVMQILSSRDPISKTLAISAGKEWSMEICARANINAMQPITDKPLAEKIARIVFALRDEQVAPTIYRQKNKIHAITPFPFVHYPASQEHALTLLDAYALAYEPPMQKEDPQDKKLTSIIQRIEMQLRRKDELTQGADENKHRGELIYEHYQELNEILTAIKAAREKFSWKEIKEKLKDHPLIKNIDEAKGTIEVEI